MDDAHQAKVRGTVAAAVRAGPVQIGHLASTLDGGRENSLARLGTGPGGLVGRRSPEVPVVRRERGRQA
jgi:hypothetical protein